MGDKVDWGQIALNWGPSGALVLVVIGIVRAIINGDLVPRKSLEREVLLYEKIFTEQKATIEAGNARNAELAKQVQILIPLAETSARTLEAIRHRAETREAA